MASLSSKNLGLFIAFLLPGFLFLWGASLSSKDVATWLVNAGAKEAPAIGGFLYTTVASLAVGLLIDGVRSAIIESVFYYIFRMERPEIESAKLKEKATLAAFNAVIENHFRYAQCYGNSAIAIIAALAFALALDVYPPRWVFVSSIVVSFALLYQSYDELRSFNDRAAAITQ